MIHQLGASLISQRHAVARVFPGIRRDRPSFADAASGDHHGLRLENARSALVRANIRRRPRNAIAILQQPRDGALHVHIEAHLHAAILQRANHFQAGAIAHVAEPLVGVPAKRALQDVVRLRCGRKARPIARVRARDPALPAREAAPCASCSGIFRRASCRGNACASRPAVSTLAMAAAMPPSAITVCALPSSDLHTTPTRAPCASASIAARKPAPPAPMIKHVMFVGFVSCPRSQESDVLNGAAGTRRT